MSRITKAFNAIVDNRLILRIAAFDVFAVFLAWDYGEWGWLRTAWRYGRAQGIPLLRFVDVAGLKARVPILLAVAACGLAVTMATHLHRREGADSLRNNRRRTREALGYALQVEERLAAFSANKIHRAIRATARPSGART